MLYIASDHAGYQLKEDVKRYLQSLNYSFEDLGAKEFNPNDDYPDFAFAVARKVVDEGGEGILLCGTGQGVCLAANKIKGIRAVSAYDEFMARQAKEHLDSNILCLGGRILDAEMAKRIVKVWLDTGFSGEERHERRLGKIEEIENSHNT
ncbi:MAG: RpiB/LacA/LacB family sugar-phosphate isomerase [Candidatus Portnoybacteria bacterium]|nr:RpiB/LacA/LacB family sugar-phosphate isomerase [Candidatus Portnoybacteria bacterium]